MTMADTVAVMNKGKIEQMGAPTDIYELPRTVFVANFLGQSNLIEGKTASSDAENEYIEAHGMTFGVPKERWFATPGTAIVGVRPEKLTIVPAANADAVPEHHNRISGRVTDASFTGMSTQYLVATPWGQELMVFEQNLAVGDRVRTGDSVIAHWSPRHSFGLDAASGRDAGLDEEFVQAVNFDRKLAAQSGDASVGG